MDEDLIDALKTKIEETKSRQQEVMRNKIKAERETSYWRSEEANIRTKLEGYTAALKALGSNV